MPKPIRVFWSPLSNRFYASAHYQVDNELGVITGAKYDVTDDIAWAVIKNKIRFSKDKPKGKSNEARTHDGQGSTNGVD